MRSVGQLMICDGSGDVQMVRAELPTMRTKRHDDDCVSHADALLASDGHRFPILILGLKRRSARAELRGTSSVRSMVRKPGYDPEQS